MSNKTHLLATLPTLWRCCYKFKDFFQTTCYIAFLIEYLVYLFSTMSFRVHFLQFNRFSECGCFTVIVGGIYLISICRYETIFSDFLSYEFDLVIVHTS
ncbi:hypothetical protein PsAD37_03268 [Pseudovibrio sp. Ad37]|nr:hypothetical protein PsAD37_03268 [Pseudovibrio sp. Ad37]